MTILTNTKANTVTRIQNVYPAFKTLEGDGFEVRRAIPAKQAQAVGPFIFLDHFGPIEVKPGEAKGASAHPHAGIETLTLLLEGSSTHKDSMGNVSSMLPGEVQWMRAGAGVIHDESPSADLLMHGGRNHGVQLWLNMPRAHKHDAPEYRHFSRDDIPVIRAEDGSYLIRLIAGQLAGQEGPLRSYGHPFVAHISFKQAAEILLPAPVAAELAVYVMAGTVQLADDDTQLVQEGQIALLQPGDVLKFVHRQDTAAEVLLIGGDQLQENIVRYGPFVMNSAQDIEQAIRDYQRGRMGVIPTT